MPFAVNLFQRPLLHTVSNACLKSTNAHDQEIIKYNKNKHNYFIPRCRLELFKRSVVPDSIKLWNLLKAEARESISIISFRKNISV